MEDNVILKAEKFMLELNKDSAHDRHHIYRVLNLALNIAESEEEVDLSVLIISCLLHDIGREEQYKNPKLCHAEVGAKKAYDFLIKEGVKESDAIAVKSAIESHRFRSKHIPTTMEAKILFDADTIDAIGAIGIARSLQYEANVGIPIYNVDEDGNVVDGKCDTEESFFKEYECKLSILQDRLYTERGKEIANQRGNIAKLFYEALKAEVAESHTILREILHV